MGIRSVKKVICKMKKDQEQRPDEECLRLVHSHLKAKGHTKLADKLMKATQLEEKQSEVHSEVNLEAIFRQYQTSKQQSDDIKAKKRKRKVEESSDSSSSSESEDEEVP